MFDAHTAAAGVSASSKMPGGVVAEIKPWWAAREVGGIFRAPGRTGGAASLTPSG